MDIKEFEKLEQARRDNRNKLNRASYKARSLLKIKPEPQKRGRKPHKINESELLILMKKKEAKKPRGRPKKIIIEI